MTITPENVRKVWEKRKRVDVQKVVRKFEGDLLAHSEELGFPIRWRITEEEFKVGEEIAQPFRDAGWKVTLENRGTNYYLILFDW